MNIQSQLIIHSFCFHTFNQLCDYASAYANQCHQH